MFHISRGQNETFGETQVSLKLLKVKVTQQCLTLCDPMDSTVHGILQATILEWAAFLSSRGSYQPRYPALQADSLPAEPKGKPKNTGVGSLSLVQQIFLTQESNWGVLHCKWILYQLRYQGSRNIRKVFKILSVTKEISSTTCGSVPPFLLCLDLPLENHFVKNFCLTLKGR